MGGLFPFYTLARRGRRRKNNNPVNDSGLSLACRARLHILTISQLWNQSDNALTNLLTIPLRYRFQNVNRASLTFIQPERRSLCAEDVRHAGFNYLSG